MGFWSDRVFGANVVLSVVLRSSRIAFEWRRRKLPLGKDLGGCSAERGFSLVEIVVSALILAFLMTALFSVFRSGTQQATKGIHHADTVQEGRRILRQICLDLKCGCVDTGKLSIAISGGDSDPPIPPPEDKPFLSSRFFQVGGKPDFPSYSFLAFPIHGRRDEVVKLDGRNLDTHAALITYELEEIPGVPVVKRLVRSEVSSGEPVSKVLSEKVCFFKIDLVKDEGPSGNLFHRLDYFRITLQLLDNFGKVDLSKGVFDSLGRFSDGSLKSKIVVADFFDVAYPEAWNRVFQNPLMERNWNTFVLGPEALSK